MTSAAPSFFEKPTVNSPYQEPTRYQTLDLDGPPLSDGRRRSESEYGNKGYES